MTLKHMILEKVRNRLSIAAVAPVLNRNFLADSYIAGSGIEIGALHHPLPVNTQKAAVKYVDRMSVDDLRNQYPELNNEKLVPVDYVADGELLESVGSSTQDFVIGNHFLEHCQNPILAIKNMVRVLKPGGIVFLAVPDKRFTFDILRPVTTIEHLLQDYEKGPAHSKEQHFREWVTQVQKIEGEQQIDAELKKLLEMDYSIHFHVWEKSDLDNLLLYLIRELKFGFEIVLSLRANNTNENVYILQKNSAMAGSAN